MNENPQREAVSLYARGRLRQGGGRTENAPQPRLDEGLAGCSTRRWPRVVFASPSGERAFEDAQNQGCNI